MMKIVYCALHDATATLDLTTYGVNGALSGLTYTTDCGAVTVSGSTLAIDGSKLSASDTTVTVSANGTAVTSFVCRQAGFGASTPA